MKIAMVHDYPPVEGGGLELNVYQMTCLLEELGHYVRIFTSRTFSNSYSGDNCSADNVAIVTANEKNAEKIVSRFDVVHVHLTFSLRPLSLLVMKECCKNEKPYVVSFHTTPSHIRFSRIRNFSGRHLLVKEVLNMLNRSKVLVITHSNQCMTELISIGLKKDIKIVPLGISEMFYSRKISPLKAMQYDIICIGEISRMKGLDVLLESLRYAKNVHNSALRTLIIGDGPLRQAMQDAAKSERLDIRFLGYIPHDEVPRHLECARTFVHLSRTENCPLAVIEALAMGKLIVATPVGGIPELSRYGNCIFVPRKASIIGNTLWRLTSESQTRNRAYTNIGRTNDKIASIHSLEAQTRTTLHTYKSLGAI